MVEETKRQLITAEELQTKNYISLKVGESAVFIIDKIEKVKVGQDFALSKADFRYEITTVDGKVLSISSWKLWGAIREALKNIPEIGGTKISLIHLAAGEYSAKVVN